MLVNYNTPTKDIRRHIKTIGFNFRIKKTSNFDYMEFYHVETRIIFPDIFTPYKLELFTPLINYLKSINIHDIND